MMSRTREWLRRLFRWSRRDSLDEELVSTLDGLVRDAFGLREHDVVCDRNAAPWSWRSPDEAQDTKANEAWQLLRCPIEPQCTEACERSYVAALDIFEALEDARGVSASYTKLGIVLLIRQEPDGALDMFAKSLAACERIDDQYGMLRCYMNMATVYNQKSLSQGFSQGSAPRVFHRLKTGARRLNRIGFEKTFRQALQLYQRALAIAEELAEEREAVGIYQSMGAVYLLQGEPLKAMEMFKAALKVGRETGAPVNPAVPKLMRDLGPNV